MAYWLKSFGTSTDPLKKDWLNYTPGIAHEATARISMRFAIGDGIIYYAVGHRKVFAHGTVTGPCQLDSTRPDWAYVCPVTLDIMIPLLDDGPALADLSLTRALTKSIKRRSHIELWPNEYSHIVNALHSFQANSV